MEMNVFEFYEHCNNKRYNKLLYIADQSSDKNIAMWFQEIFVSYTRDLVCLRNPFGTMTYRCVSAVQVSQLSSAADIITIHCSDFSGISCGDTYTLVAEFQGA